MNTNTRPNWPGVILTLLLGTGTCSAVVYHYYLDGESNLTLGASAPQPAETSPKPEPPLSPEAIAAWERVKPHLTAADKKAVAAEWKACDRVSEFFAGRRKRCRSFAEEALGTRGKWEYLKSTFTGAEGHRHFLHATFEEKVFSQKELADLLKSVVEEYQQTIRGIDSQLLVEIRADLADAAPPEIRDATWLKADEAFRRQFAAAFGDIRKTAGVDIRMQGGSFVLSGLAADFAAQLLTPLCLSLAGRLGVSATITGSGLASGVATLGVGLIAGIVIDMFLDYLLPLLGFDAVSDIADDTDLYLDVFAGVLIFGDSFEEKGPHLRLLLPFPNKWEQRDRRANDKRTELWKQRQERIKKSKEPYDGLSTSLFKAYADGALARNRAVLKLIQGGVK